MNRLVAVGLAASLAAAALVVIVDRAAVGSLREPARFDDPLLTAVSAQGRQVVLPARLSWDASTSGPLVRFQGTAVATAPVALDGALRMMLPVEASNPFGNAAWSAGGWCARVESGTGRRSSGVPRILVDTFTRPPTPWFECVIAIPGRGIPLATTIPWQWRSGDRLVWNIVYRAST